MKILSIVFLLISASTHSMTMALHDEAALLISQKETPTTIDHEPFNRLLQRHVSTKGTVNYKGFKNDWKALKKYISTLGANVPNSTWSKEDTLAYWINAYNALTIDLILRNYPVASIKDIDRPWKQRLWTLGGKTYNLDEIEHQIIRKMGDPRIHFALVCAAASCPKLYNQAFTGVRLNDDLNQLTRSFLADQTKNSIGEDHLELSKIFQWFAKDFKQTGSVIDFINNYTDINISSKAKKTYKDYNWALNE